MRFLQWLLCLFGRHQRDHRAVQQRDGQFHSRCVGCKRPMVREAHGWRLEAKPAPGAE